MYNPKRNECEMYITVQYIEYTNAANPEDVLKSNKSMARYYLFILLHINLSVVLAL